MNNDTVYMGLAILVGVLWGFGIEPPFIIVITYGIIKMGSSLFRDSDKEGKNNE